MKHKLYAILIALLLAAVLAGCGQESRESSLPDSTSDSTDPTHFYEEVAEGLTVDAQVSGRTPGVVPAVYTGSFPALDRAAVDRFLAVCGDAVANVELDVEKGNVWNFVATTDKDAYVGAAICVDSMELNSYSFSYSSSEYHWYGDVLACYPRFYRAKYPEWDNSDWFREPKAFGFATEQEADAQVRSFLELLGVQNVALNETLYLDHRVMEEAQHTDAAIQKMTGKGQELKFKESWTEADDAYHFTYEITQDGFPMVPEVNTGAAQIYIPSMIEVICNRDGIVYLQVFAPWASGEQTEAPETILTAREALENAKEILCLTPVSYERVVKEVSLRYYYVYDGDRCLLRPCWYVATLGLQVPQLVLGEVVDEPRDEYSFILLDAVTGQEV
ncbi:MAG: hypothetical protein ACI3V3_07630 [Faecousia sp.]